MLTNTPFRFTGKEPDPETGLYYFGARYLDPKTSRWMSADPAVGDYFPSAPVDDGARRRNESLPGLGGVFNYVNLHVYHYGGNNPVRYIDPDGRQTITPDTTKEQFDEMNRDVFSDEVSSWWNHIWNEMQLFFENNPDGAFYRAPGELHWQQYENEGDIRRIDPNSAIFDMFLFRGIGKLAFKGGSALLSKVFAFEMTRHGAQRIAGVAATRGGVLAINEINNVLKKGLRYSAENNTNVFVLINNSGRADVVVMGNSRLITTFKNISNIKLERLANNYGWIIR